MEFEVVGSRDRVGWVEPCTSLFLGKTDCSLVCSRQDCPVTESVIHRWITTCESLRILRVSGSLIGFATLSRQECALQPHEIEACHLYIDPKARKQYFGSQLLLSLQRDAKSLGYRRLVGRVARGNDACAAMLSRLSWQPVANQGLFVCDDPVTWYERNLMDASF